MPPAFRTDLAPAVRQLMQRIDKTVIPDEVMTLEQRLADTIAPRRWNLLMLGTFAASALALALIGIYGLMTYSIAQRRQEIGVRRALGAQRVEVVRMVVRQGMSIALAGIGLGVVSSVALTRVMSSPRPDTSNCAALMSVASAAKLTLPVASVLRVELRAGARSGINSLS